MGINILYPPSQIIHMKKIWVFAFVMFLIIIGIASEAKKPKKVAEELTTTSTRLYIDPSAIIDPSLNVGDTFIVDVRVEGVTDLSGFEFKLYWNTNVLSVVPESTDAHPNNLWSSNFPWSDAIDDAGGYYHVGYSRRGTASTFNGDTSLATITFRVESDGLSILDLSGAKLGDSNALSISHEVGDGIFSNYDCNTDGTLPDGLCHEACGANSFCDLISPGTTVIPESSSDCSTGNTYTRDKCSDTCQREDTDICGNYFCDADWDCNGRTIDSVFCSYYWYEGGKATCNSTCNSIILEYCPSDYASDSDGGQDFTVRGTCTVYQGCSGGECQNTSYTDYCVNGTTLKEYYSDWWYCDSIEKNCKSFGSRYYCSNGRCRRRSGGGCGRECHWLGLSSDSELYLLVAMITLIILVAIFGSMKFFVKKTRLLKLAY